MDAPSPVPPDEDSLILPADWREVLHPRRGGLPVPVAPPDEEALRRTLAFVEGAAERLTQALVHRRSDPALVGHLRAYLGGDPDPLGAAAVALLVTERPSEADHAALVDLWVAGRGLPFAACAYAATDEVAVGWDRPGGRGDWEYYLERPRESDGRGADPAARRLRSLLAVADPDAHAETVARLEDWRRTPGQRVMTAYLDPTRREWVDDVLSNRPHPGRGRTWMLYHLLDGPERLGGLALRIRVDRSMLATLLEGVGAAALPMLRDAIDHADGADRGDLLAAVALLPTDEAFRTLLDRAGRRVARPVLREAMERFPRRAVRLLAAAAVDGHDHAPELLRRHLGRHPEAAGAVLPDLPAPARRTVEEITADAALPEAPPEALPRLLVEPPWTRGRRAARPTVIEGLTVPTERAVVWNPGERERWAPGLGTARFAGIDWEPEVREVREGRLPRRGEAFTLTHAPEDLVRPLVEDRRGIELRYPADSVRALVARFGLDALPLALSWADTAPRVSGGALLPFRDAGVAAVMADWLVRRGTGRTVARSWFRRHGVAAVPFLVPAALGPAGQERRNAEGALRFVAARSGADAVVAEARPFGEETAAAIGEMLSADPLKVLPARMPRPAAWADPALLPPLMLRGRSGALPATAVGHLLSMMALSKPDDHYAGLAVVRELCDPASLRRFSWAVFQAWLDQDTPTKEMWALSQLGAFGDDATARRLTPLVKRWPGEGGTTRAATGVEVLAEIGTETALLCLHDITQRAKAKGLRARARERIEEIAAGLGLTPDRLADRLVPDFGLDERGSMVLDYGPRRFHVGFDETLRPYVVDGDGARLRTLPRPGRNDDPDLAPAAAKLFARLGKEVPATANAQVRRLETAMLERRRWSAEEFGGLLVAHPLVWHLVRRLVWVAEDGDKTAAFRVAEDRSFADVHDDVLTLPASARIGVAHPVELGDDLAAWAEVFADYEITQPFAQLSRPALALTDAERGDHRLTRFEGAVVSCAALRRLHGRGWLRSSPPWEMDDARWLVRRLAADRHVMIVVSPGIPYDTGDDPDQTVERVWIGTESVAYAPERAAVARFGDLDPVTASEVLADLTALVEST
ncbi:hypothetical protein GCM10009678_38170 [Actinomadura kijaniata]|uniref:DUF4132 domain-containing protein n=1 Tax=Actinomadura namibiensis TaxID=182080 RepID=A0A7W3LV76_ACTNM|nr:DUF4132 domain-containing protein [Actinomadura namibiensis]MBA8954934.1 hypothetical protein [Actinomadura namibiensis]